MRMNTSPLANTTRPSRLLRRTAFVLAALLTLIAAFYIIENWRGRRAWDNCQRELKAKGEQLDWAAYVPARVPDEQNFIKIPLLEAVGYRNQVNTNIWRTLEDARQHLVWDAWVDPQTGRKLDWPKYQKALRARAGLDFPPLPREPAADLLHALREVEPQLDELRAASLKPLAQFDIDRSAPFEESRDVNFVALRSLSQLLAYHACAELAMDHPEKAFADVRAIHRLSDGLKGECTLVALMIHVALQGLALEPFWQGWAEGRWTDRELARFQELFGRVDLLPEFAPVMRAERAGITELIEKYGLRGNEFWRVTMRGEPGPKDQWKKLGWKLIPRGWICQNLVSYHQCMQTFSPVSLQSTPPTVSPAQVNDLRDRVPREIPGGPYGWLSQMAIPNFAKALETIARVQTFVNQAGIVCALERCRKVRGQYPDSLAELAPQFMAQLPVDVVNGGPMKYRRTNDGKFLLYSVGWNEIDDAGTPALTRDTPAKLDFTRGDWVWRYPVDH